jgi:hypothetical protein
MKKTIKLMNELKELRKWKDTAQYCREMSVLCSPNQYSGSYFLGIGKLILKFTWRSKRPTSTVQNREPKNRPISIGSSNL